MSQLIEIFFHSNHAPYLLGSYAAVLVVLTANVVLSLLRGRSLKDEIRRELDLKSPQP